MRSVFAVFLLATSVSAQTLTPVGPAPAAPADGNKFTFVVAGDNRPKKAKDPQPPQLSTIAKDLAKTKPAFALWDGDIVYGKETKKVGKQYPGWTSIIETGGVPVFVAPGNHEMDVIGSCNGQKADVPDSTGKMLEEYEKHIGPAYGTFRYGNSAFIAINTDDVIDAGVTIDPCTYNGYVGQAQVAALKQALDSFQADDSVTNIFVFMHRPIKPEKSKDGLGPASLTTIAQVISLLESTAYTKLGFVFASHEHLFYADGKDQKGPFVNDKRRFLITGGAGAPLSKKGTGTYHHYLTVSVDHAKVTVTIVPIP